MIGTEPIWWVVTIQLERDHNNGGIHHNIELRCLKVWQSLDDVDRLIRDINWYASMENATVYMFVFTAQSCLHGIFLRPSNGYPEPLVEPMPPAPLRGEKTCNCRKRPTVLRRPAQYGIYRSR